MEDKKTRIYQCAKELFSSNGFKDTGISDITKKAGMAVGTFYNYYPSKEKLFMDIYLEENEKLKRSCLQALDLSRQPLDVVREMLVKNEEGIAASPILREWYNKGVYQKLEQLFREEHGVQAVDFLYDSFHVLVTQWQAEGKMRRDIDSKMIMMVFAAIINADTHKEEIGIDYFPQLTVLMTELIMDSLTRFSEPQDIEGGQHADS